jgi:hypothetical protein
VKRIHVLGSSAGKGAYVVLFEYENMAMKDNQNEVARDMWVEALSSLFKGDSKEGRPDFR